MKSRNNPQLHGFYIPQFSNLQFHEGSVKAFMKKKKQNIKPQNSTTPCTRVATRNRWAQAEDTEKKSFKYSKNSVNSVVNS
jgi:hypothetical protein